MVVAVRGDGDKPQERRDDQVVGGEGEDPPEFMHGDGLDFGKDLPPLFVRESADRLDLREEAAHLPDDEEVVQHRKRHGGRDVMVVVPRQDQDGEHRHVLRNGRARADVGDHVAAVVGAQHGAAVGEEEIADRRVDEMDQVEDVEVQSGRKVAVYEHAQKRQEAQAHGQYRRADPAVDRAVEPQVGAHEFPVVVRHRLVHGTHHGRAEAQFREGQHAEDGDEQSVEAQVFRSEQPEEERAVKKGEQQPHALVQHAGQNVPFRVFRKVQFHDSTILLESLARRFPESVLRKRSSRKARR